MTGCKLNSKMVPIITEIKNGDIVEIITSENSKGPSLDWLKFVKSTSAKTKINSWFKKEKKAENIEKGKEQIEKELKRLGISHEKLFKVDYINAMLNRYKYKDLEEMYAAVGFGANTATKVIARMLIEYRKDHKEEDIEEKLKELEITRTQKKTKPSNNGVIVKGIDNCLVKLSKCCNPLPGDEIIGYITRGRGVSVHRKDCVNIKDLFKEENRIIDVAWEKEQQASYDVNLTVLANDRLGLLADIMNVLSNTKANLVEINGKTGKNRIALIDITIEIKNLDELNNILKSIRKVDSVYEVKRRRI